MILRHGLVTLVDFRTEKGLSLREWLWQFRESKGKKVKVSYLRSVAKQARLPSYGGPTVWKSPVVGIEHATFRSQSAVLTTAPRDPKQSQLPQNEKTHRNHGDAQYRATAEKSEMDI